MINQRIVRTNQQYQNETSLTSSILQRTAVRSVPETTVQPIENAKSLALSTSLHQDFSRVPITTTKPQQIMAKLKVSSVEQQGKGEAIQRQEMSEAFGVHKENKTGLPDNLKEGIENLSGIRMDDVRVHYKSHLPAQLQALAYTQGTEIYVAPGQEEHLPHEAWHVVQQKQGRVKPTLQALGMQMNDDAALEREAEERGEQALSKAIKEMTPLAKQRASRSVGNKMNSQPIQKYKYSAGGANATTDSGTWVKAEKMFNGDPDLAKGKPVTKWPKWWPSTDPQTAEEFMRVNFVQGHLLNEKLGGKGDRRENLTPLTRSANAQMSKTIEDQVKLWINQNYYVDYLVTADYTNGSADVAHVGGSILLQAEQNKLGKYLNYVPGWIKAEYTLYDSSQKPLPLKNQPDDDWVKNEGTALRGAF